MPITASSANGRPLTFTITSSTNAIAIVPHTNNPFWKLSVDQAAAANAPGAEIVPYVDRRRLAPVAGDTHLIDKLPVETTGTPFQRRYPARPSGNDARGTVHRR